MSGVTVQCDKCHRDWITYGDPDCPWCQLESARNAAKEALECFDIVTQCDVLANMTVGGLRVDLLNRHPWLE